MTTPVGTASADAPAVALAASAARAMAMGGVVAASRVVPAGGVVAADRAAAVARAVATDELPLPESLRVVDAVLADVAAGAGIERIWALSVGELADGLRQVHSARARLAAVEAALIMQADAVGAKDQTGASSTASWLSSVLRTHRVEAGRMVRFAQTVTAQPPAVEVLATGVASPAHAQVVADAMEQLDGSCEAMDPPARAAAIDFLTTQAGLLTPPELSRAATALIETMTAAPSVDDPEEAAAVAREEARRARDRWLAITTRHDGTSDGRWHRLDAVGTAALITFLERAAHRSAPTPTNEATAGEETAEGAGPDGSPHGPAPDTAVRDERSHSERMVDALSSLAQLALAGAHLPGEDGGRRPQLMVTVDYNVLTGQLGAGTLTTGITLPPDQVRRLACDAGLLPAVLAGPSTVLDLGRTVRLFNPAQRRALALRDGGCTWPGCPAKPLECDAHHLVHWVDGGLTNVSNGSLLCDYHHAKVHREGWTGRPTPDGYVAWVPPPTVDPARRPRIHHRLLLRTLTRSQPPGGYSDDLAGLEEAQPWLGRRPAAPAIGGWPSPPGTTAPPTDGGTGSTRSGQQR